jgi:hypothetical protein
MRWRGGKGAGRLTRWLKSRTADTLLKKNGLTPKLVVTDKLRSGVAAVTPTAPGNKV